MSRPVQSKASTMIPPTLSHAYHHGLWSSKSPEQDNDDDDCLDNDSNNDSSFNSETEIRDEQVPLSPVSVSPRSVLSHDCFSIQEEQDATGSTDCDSSSSSSSSSSSENGIGVQETTNNQAFDIMNATTPSQEELLAAAIAAKKSSTTLPESLRHLWWSPRRNQQDNNHKLTETKTAHSYNNKNDDNKSDEIHNINDNNHDDTYLDWIFKGPPGAPLGLCLDNDTLQVLDAPAHAALLVTEGLYVVQVEHQEGSVAQMWEWIKDPARPKHVRFARRPRLLEEDKRDDETNGNEEADNEDDDNKIEETIDLLIVEMMKENKDTRIECRNNNEADEAPELPETTTPTTATTTTRTIHLPPLHSPPRNTRVKFSPDITLHEIPQLYDEDKDEDTWYRSDQIREWEQSSRTNDFSLSAGHVRFVLGQAMYINARRRTIRRPNYYDKDEQLCIEMDHTTLRQISRLLSKPCRRRAHTRAQEVAMTQEF